MLRQKIFEWVLRQKQKTMQVSEDYSVKEYLDKIPKYFDEGKVAEDRSLTVVYQIHDSGDNNGSWTVAIADKKCEITEGEAENFDTKLYMTAETYRRILTGRLDYVRLAYSTGAVRFYGNSLGHRELNSYVTIPQNAGIAAI